MKPSGRGCVLPHFVRRYRSFSCDLFDVGSSFNSLPVDISIIEAGLNHQKSWVRMGPSCGNSSWKGASHPSWVVFRWDISDIPVNIQKLLNMAIYSEFSHSKWRCSTVMLVYQRVPGLFVQIVACPSTRGACVILLWYCWLLMLLSQTILKKMILI